MPKPNTHLPDPQSTPKPELEKRTRRVFTAEYKLNILKQADACKHGELGALLRREKLYHNQLADWRRELAQNGIKGLGKSLPGPTSKRTPEQKRIAQLEKENEKLRQQMQVKDDCLALQKKALNMLDALSNESSTS